LAFESTCEDLALHPLLGSPRAARQFRTRGLRTWRVKGFAKYLIFYRPVVHGVEVLHVLHGAQDHARILRAREIPDEPA
jgi:toxin ParE1/3/4